jgi:hypothetical protein
MGRGDLPKVRWRNDRVKKKREREKRQSDARAEARGVTPRVPGPPRSSS